jgi:hypothetical protein
MMNKRKFLLTAAIAVISIVGIAFASNRFTNFPNGIGLNGTEVTSTATELNVLHGRTSDQLNTRVLNVPLTCTGADTVLIGVISVNRAITITEASVAFSQYPSSAPTTVSIKLQNWDASAGASDALLAAAVVIDTAFAAGDNGYQKDLTLTATPADLVLANGDRVEAQVIATSTIVANSCQGGVLSVGYTNY